MRFKKCMYDMLSDYFYGTEELCMINDSKDMVIRLGNISNDDCSTSLVLFCDVLKDIEIKYTYNLFIASYNPYYDPLENDSYFLEQFDEFIAKNYLFNETDWSVYNGKEKIEIVLV